MNDLTLNLIVILVFAVLAGAIFLIVRRAQSRQEEQLRQLALERGWSYAPVREPLAWGFNIKSPHWTLESLSRSSGKEAGPGSSNVAQTTRWHSDAVSLPGRLALAGTNLSGGSMDGKFGSFALQMLLKTVGENMSAGGLAKVQVGSPALRQKFMFVAQESADAHKLYSPAVESALLAWKTKGMMVIKLSSQGLQIDINGNRVKTSAEISALVQLGETLLTAAQRG